MHQFYQSHQVPLARRATEPVTLAPTASMIDPNLESHRMQQSQINAAYGRPQIPSPHIILNGFHPNHSAPTERKLPPRDIDDNSIDDAYVQFIMYCNPSIPANVDTSELKKGFRTPPKSDGKTFSPHTLFGLISRLEAKDIKTWTQLVIELGVEPPDAAKNQSSQKVQQYAVRLKVHSFTSHIYRILSLSSRATAIVRTDVGADSDGFVLFTSMLSSVTCITSPLRMLKKDPRRRNLWPKRYGKVFRPKKTSLCVLYSLNGDLNAADEKPRTSRLKSRQPRRTKNSILAPAALTSQACLTSSTQQPQVASYLGAHNPSNMIHGQQLK